MVQRVLLTFALAGIVCGIAGTSSAQDLSGLKVADDVSVTFRDGHTERGSVDSVSASQLTLTGKQQPRRIDLTSVESIYKRGDSIRNGTLAGIIAGSGVAALTGGYVNALCDNEGGRNCPSLRVTSVVFPILVGAAIGAAVDGSRVGKTLVWSRNSMMSIAPVVGPGALGFQATVSLR